METVVGRTFSTFSVSCQPLNQFSLFHFVPCPGETAFEFPLYGFVVKNQNIVIQLFAAETRRSCSVSSLFPFP